MHTQQNHRKVSTNKSKPQLAEEDDTAQCLNYDTTTSCGCAAKHRIFMPECVTCSFFLSLSLPFSVSKALHASSTIPNLSLWLVRWSSSSSRVDYFYLCHLNYCHEDIPWHTFQFSPYIQLQCRVIECHSSHVAITFI